MKMDTYSKTKYPAINLGIIPSKNDTFAFQRDDFRRRVIFDQFKPWRPLLYLLSLDTRLPVLADLSTLFIFTVLWNKMNATKMNRRRCREHFYNVNFTIRRVKS